MGISFTDRELDVMAVLWQRGSGTVGEVQEALEDDLAYTTVLTTLRNMEEKGYVVHEEEGRAYRYHPTVERSEAGESALRRLVEKVFGGSTELFLTHLLPRKGAANPETLERLRRTLDRRFAASEEEGEGEEEP